MKFKFKHLTVAALSLSLVLNSSWIHAEAPASTTAGTTIGNIIISDGEINLDHTGKEQNLINISDYYKGTGTVKYKVEGSDDFSTTVPTATDAGKYDVYYYILGDSNYNGYHEGINDVVSKFNDAKSAWEVAKASVEKLTNSSTSTVIDAAKALVAAVGTKIETVKTTTSTSSADATSLDDTVKTALTALTEALGNANDEVTLLGNTLDEFATSISGTDATIVETKLNAVQDALHDVQTMFSRAETKLDAVVAAEEAIIAASPSHVVVNIVAKEGGTPSTDGTSDSSGSSDSSSSNDSSKTTVPMTVNYSVSSDGTTSAVIDRKGIIWLREESGGTGAWYAIDNSYGAFELGSTFHVKWLKEGDKDYTKYFNQLDDEYKKKAETNNIEIFLVGVTKPDGITEYTNFIRDDKWYGDGGVGLYVQLGDDWDANDINALFISEGSDSPVTVQYGTASKFMSLYDGILFPETDSKYARLTLTHFSPYAVLGAKKSSSSSSSLSSLSSYYKTGEDYSTILCLLSMSSISLIYALILRKRKLF